MGLDIKISYHNDFAGAQVLDIFHGRGQVGENREGEIAKMHPLLLP